jgi:hypothetical protein
LPQQPRQLPRQRYHSNLNGFVALLSVQHLVDDCVGHDRDNALGAEGVLSVLDLAGRLPMLETLDLG